MKTWLVAGLPLLTMAALPAEQSPAQRPRAARQLVQVANPQAKPAVVELFEDDAEPFLGQLTQIDAPSEAARDEKDKFAGVCSIRITPLQRYNPTVKNWQFAIVEKPEPGQYRYVRFAWKKIGGNGIMVQFHTANRGWEQRYTAGAPSVPWPARSVAQQAPRNWEVVTRDLFKDFGNLTLTGIALTPIDGTAGLYDHIYLGRTIEDLDKVTNAALGKNVIKEAPTAQQLGQFWADLASADVALSAPAAANLAARPVESLPFLEERLRTPKPTDQEAKRIAQLIDALDDNDEAVRAGASAALERLGKIAVTPLREARVFKPALSLEAHRRIERLLQPFETEEIALAPESRQWLQAIRVLERIGTGPARDLLARVADGTPEAGLHREAKAALDRLAR